MGAQSVGVKGTAQTSSFSGSASRQERRLRNEIPACLERGIIIGHQGFQRAFRKNRCSGKWTHLVQNTALPAKSRTTHLGPFGELIRATGPMAKLNPFRFSTKYQDDETDLVYYGYRYYNASTGRWLSRDPLAERGGPNLYGFIHNAPISKKDVLGLVSLTDMINLITVQFPQLAEQMGIGTALDLTDSDTIGFVEGAYYWFFGNGSDQHLGFSAYDPGWGATDFPGFNDKAREVCAHCGSSFSLNPPLVRNSNAYSDIYTIARKGAPGRYNVQLEGQFNSVHIACGCQWTFSGKVSIPRDRFDFNANAGRSVDAESITALVSYLQTQYGVGHDFWLVFDGSRDVSASGKCSLSENGF
jgi:RHS repeat-associated protein